MKRKLFVACLIGLIIGYVIGIVFPLSILKPSFTNHDEFSRTEYFRFVISIISALITFSAVFVALFKEDLREYWKRPKIKIAVSDNPTYEEFKEDSDSASYSDSLTCSQYFSKVEIENCGNLSSNNTEIILEKLEFSSKESSIVQSIECTGHPLDWNGSDSKSIFLAVGAKKTITIISISAPEKFSNPNTQSKKAPSKVIIGNMLLKPEHSIGKWTATFTIYSQNHKPSSFVVEIEWNGIWKPRLTEFKTLYNFILKK